MWQAHASRIPDQEIRDDALSSLGRKRGHTDGAALFCILAGARNSSLLRLLVAYEIMWDFLDSVNEHGAEQGPENGKQLHLALVDALSPGRPLSDYYRFHPWHNDGGYLRALVQTCREQCVRLPSFPAVQSILMREAWRGQALAINHDLDPVRRDRALREWAQREWPPLPDTRWFELTAAASASLTIHALFALATRTMVSASEINTVQRAYNPWISAATTMLDSFVDQAEDAINGDHSYVAHYSSRQTALARVSELVDRAATEAAALPDGERHVLIVAAMLTMYLSKDSARTVDMRGQTRALIQAGGPLARLLLPILRLWRIAYAQRST
jgi:tetraprenyl-beta-curcumene synthase